VLENQLFEERVAEALHRCAFVLAPHELRVDRAPDVGCRHSLADANDAGFGLDLDLGRGDAHFPEDRPLGVRTAAGRGNLASTDQLAAGEPEVSAQQIWI